MGHAEGVLPRVMTPVLLGQFRLFYDQQKPIGVVFWGFVMPEACFQHDAEVEARLAQGVSRLKPQDWKSGDRLWVVEVISPFGGADEMVKDLKAKVFPSRDIHMLMTSGERRQEVRLLS